MVNVKSKEEMTEEKKLKKGKKNKNEKATLQNNNCVNDRILTVLYQEKESCVQADEKAGKKKKKKEKYVNECLFNTTNGEDVSKKTKKKKKQDSDCKMEAPLCKIKDNKKRKKSTCADLEHVEIDEEELPKKIKKKKNAETVEWKKEKKKNTADGKTCDAIEEKHSKKHKKSSQIVAENQETTEETGDSEGVKKSKTALKPVKNKKVKTREHGNKVTVAEIKDDVKKKEKPAKSDYMKEEKKKPKKTALECADVEEPQLRQKKKKSKKHSVQDEAEPPLVNYEEQQSEEKLTETGTKKKKRKDRTTMVDAPAEHLCSGNAPKPKKTKKVKEEVRHQNVSGQSKQHRIHFQALNFFINSG